MPGVKTRRIPSYRLHKPTGLAVVRLNGKDFYLGKHGTPESQEEYTRRIAEWLTNHCHPFPSADEPKREVSGLTVNELILAYMDHVSRHYVKHGRYNRKLWMTP